MRDNYGAVPSVRAVDGFAARLRRGALSRCLPRLVGERRCDEGRRRRPRPDAAARSGGAVAMQGRCVKHGRRSPR